MEEKVKQRRANKRQASCGWAGRMVKVKRSKFSRSDRRARGSLRLVFAINLASSRRMKKVKAKDELGIDHPDEFTASTLSFLDSTLRCPICSELFVGPVLLTSCSHTFCSKCLRQVSTPPLPSSERQLTICSTERACFRRRRVLSVSRRLMRAEFARIRMSKQ